ncbi:hypothetical protein P3T37_000665 [Kitasatospora sp. MAA4]|uniref:hypothetical protein n=1 Tax=Kitasatospora sp. MAA4 TaxID=3035093 RepID=UPI00247626A5|nr:hypothetical protein [Kitasatospora sp. MAA4]MDH6131296.1 hypothetical protein [Kitasatospora sp. MAA4]
MDPIVLAAGTALVGAMATDSWEGARAALVALWRRVHQDQAGAIEVELAQVRAQVIAARGAGNTEAEQVLAGNWQLRLRELLATDPTLEGDLRRLLDEQLAPALAADGPIESAMITMRAKVSGHGRVYQAGRDQHIIDR